LSALGDILDGQVARATGSGSAAGEILDASVDRYMEWAFIGGMAIYFRAEPLHLAVALAALQAAFMISYSTAKAEAAGVPPPKGLMRRHERAVYLISGAVLSSFFGSWLLVAALAVVAVAGNVSAIRRLAAISRALRARDKEPT
jgi:CDP-diacylglycerol---glycerol-3-phosphate 3-phosphatidyltransferase